jgi:hypothetical protein
MSVVIFDCLTFAVELLVLLSSPIPILEHELTSSFGFVVVVLDAFSTKEKKNKISPFFFQNFIPFVFSTV